MIRDPAFWALVAGFASIWTGIVSLVNPSAILMRHEARSATGLVLIGVAIVATVTAVKVLG